MFIFSCFFLPPFHLRQLFHLRQGASSGASTAPTPPALPGPAAAAATAVGGVSVSGAVERVRAETGEAYAVGSSVKACK